LIPLDYIQELSRFQDRVPPFPYEEAREIVREEAGQLPEDIF